jgi:hypothetical protein
MPALGLEVLYSVHETTSSLRGSRVINRRKYIDSKLTLETAFRILFLVVILLA